MAKLLNVARVHRIREEFERAEGLIKIILALLQKRKHVFEQSYLEVVFESATVYLDQGRLNQAYSILAPFVRIATKSLGCGHECTLIYKTDLARVYGAMGQFANKLLLMSHCLSVSCVCLEPISLVSLKILRHLAMRLFLLGRCIESDVLIFLREEAISSL